MNIIEAIKQVKLGKVMCIYGKAIYFKNGELLDIISNQNYIPTLDDIVSNNWYELPTSVGSILKIHDDIYKIFAGHNDKRYLLDVLKDTIIEEYDNETLLNEDIMRRLYKNKM